MTTADFNPDSPDSDSIADAILRAAAGDDLAIFAYGSLLWSPDFAPRAQWTARAMGFSRRLCVYSERYRGRPGAPGLVFGLERGGSCWGRALVLPRRGRRTIARALVEREMFAGAYEARFVPTRARDGRAMRALAFVARRDSPTYAGRLSEEEIVRLTRGARGARGGNWDYVRETAAHLRAAGVPCPHLDRLLARGREIAP